MAELILLTLDRSEFMELYKRAEGGDPRCAAGAGIVMG
jgi:hypothetical protein